MNFAFTDEQAMIAETARGFFAAHATSQRTRAAMAGDGIDHALWASFCGDLGLSGVALPEAYGGAGLGMVEFCSIAEAAGAQVAAVPLLGLAKAGQAIAAGGSSAQRAQWLPPLILGDAIAASAASLDLQAQDDRLTGTFERVPHAASANLFVAASATGAWLVEPKSPGVTIKPHVTMDQTRPLATVTLSGVPGDPLPDSTTAIAAARAVGWLCLAAEALGGAQVALDRTVCYARERVQFGRPIGSFQAYKHRLADMMVAIEQARSAVYWAACAYDEAAPDGALALHAAKSFCADTFFKCAGDMIQLHGGIGFTWDHDAHLFFKRARSIQTMLGNGAWHREQVAAMVLGQDAMERAA